MKALSWKTDRRVPDPGMTIVDGPTGFRVRPATGSDAEAMLSLIRTHAAYEGGEASVSLDALRSTLDLKPAPLTAWVAVQAGGLIGYATATMDFSTWAGRPFLHLDCLFVGEGHRGSGIGAALLNAVRAHTAAFGMSEIQWQTPDWNENAARFYLREGASMLPKARFTLRTM